MDAWLKEAKADKNALENGMYLVHNGTVRRTPKAQVRQGINEGLSVSEMEFSYDADKADAAVRKTLQMEGIFFVRTWMNEGLLEVGDDIMYVMIGGDIRPHVIDALQFLVGMLKNECVVEVERHS